MPVVIDVAEDDRRDVIARTNVLHAGRDALKSLADASPGSLHGRKAVTDFLVAASSVPDHLDDQEAVSWLATDWNLALEQLLRYRTSREVRGAGDPRTAHTRSAVKRLRNSLMAGPHGTTVLDDLFGTVLDVCRKAYGPDRWIEPTVCVELAHTHPGRWPGSAANAGWAATGDRYALTGETIRSGDAAEVVLSFFLEEFGPESYAALPRLMMHECFCHVPSGHDPVENDQASAFAEGWMDWAASHFFERAVLDTDPSLQQLARYHGRMFAAALSHRSNSGWARDTGIDHADLLADWFTRLGFEPTSAAALTAGLAVEINVSSASLVVKDRLTAALGELPDLPVWLRRPLRRWLSGDESAEEILRAVERHG